MTVKKSTTATKPKTKAGATLKAAPKAKKSRSQSRGSPAPSLLRRLLSFSWKLGLVVTVLVASYCIYLDQIIASKFEGQKWYLPAQVFSRPMALYPGAAISHQQVIEELLLLGYRKVANPRQVGEFSASSTRIQLWRRPFLHPDGKQPEQQVMLSFDSQGLTSVARMSDNRQLAVFYLEPVLLDRIIATDGEDRLFVPTAEMPQYLVESLLLVEDRSFYEHHGINPIAIIRAAMVNMSAGRTVQGGSTITQQLAKNFFLSSERSLERKIREALMALIIDFRYSKQEILEAYLNEVYMGQDKSRAVHGIGLASQFYFGRPVAELTLAQQAFLIASIKGPSYYNPWRYPERALERRNLVLKLLMENNKISVNDYIAAVDTPLSIRKESKPVRARLPAFFAQVKRELASRYGDALLTQSGIKVYTTLDPLAQEAAQKAVSQTMKQLDKRAQDIQAGMVVTDKYSAGIAAMVGDRLPGFAGFDRAADIRRPIGSLVKPFVYVTALEQASYNLMTPLTDQPITLNNGQGTTWSPQNVTKTFSGEVSLLQALSQSMNVPTVNLGMALGIDAVKDTLTRAGWNGAISDYPSIFLGAIDGSPLMVAQVYQTLADGGRYRQLHAVTHVLDTNNQAIIGRDVDAGSAIPAGADYLVKYAMTQVVEKGTAKRLGQQFANVTLAGKTGTSNDGRDAWFAGFDERNVAAIWVGLDNNGKTNLYGSSGAMAVYQAFLGARAPISLRMLPPQGVVTGYFDKTSGVAMASDCANVVAEPALAASYHPAKNCGQPLNWWQKLIE
ncbi:penicillin-binding protein 1B [Shewanella sp. NIFS-20-20]|uniref:penicillin-binding protein 1B n=1 Tax=Shewanella sp. NIFS-20-20 TaxID=2853806 RepID=UPI001C493A37|nr:penicillin-binding protein 1B [Shewanella sp. NIFS-20-20]MBV7314141.1 penicillin-binding protein 1B [Shewanella sp. NIFS-20-20]